MQCIQIILLSWDFNAHWSPWRVKHNGAHALLQEFHHQ